MDLSAGTPQPLAARFWAGSSALYHSKTLYASSGCSVAPVTIEPVAVMVGSRRSPFQVGAGSMTIRPAAIFSLISSLAHTSTPPLNQKPYCTSDSSPLAKSCPGHEGLGLIGLELILSAARS